MMYFKHDIIVIKSKLIPIIGMLSDDEIYTKEKAAKDLTNILRLLDEAEPRV
ncbi:hypothetical protein FIU87_05485 [Bacillus sp. THAF10]|uniref:hypothetical protein n=1 Tax=Bacillus sp. THAF10 TaxID=2587848 RepID=UPI0012A7AA11|nr:hypothetical protein [Bacillus sp. THAF10]QFT88084.1 hypothetical protein FIU87_05485 [Bacillus sp. THAF10]